MKKYRISLDFDGTLRDNEQVQGLAAQLSNMEDIELWITTRRYRRNNEHEEVYQMADSLDIPKERVVFTNRKYKAPSLIGNNIDIHIDDDPTEAVFFSLGSHHRVLCIIRPEWEKEFWSYLEDLKVLG